MAKMAKSFKYIVMFLALALVFVFAFTGCGSGMEKFKDGPKASDIVEGNGSLAVTKGDYIYFVNGYTSCEDTDNSNYDQTVTYGALYRAKLKDGLPESVYDEDSEDNDGSRAIKNVDVLVKKVVGFENMGLYIFGDYIYFTSPSTDVDKELKIQNKKVMFFRTKIDRSTAAERLYTTESDGDSISFNMLKRGNDVFLMILDGTNFQIIKFDSNNKKSETKIKNVSSVAFARYTSSGSSLSEFNHDVYYTRTIQESDTGLQNGNIVGRYSLSESKNYDRIFADNNTTITFKFASRDKVFYEKTLADSHLADNKAIFCSARAINQINASDVELATKTYSDYLLLGGNRIVVNDGSALVLEPSSLNRTLYSGSATIIDVYGDFIYFFDTSSNVLKRVSQTTYVVETVIEKAKTTSKNCAVLYANKAIYLSTDQKNDAVYLHMVDLVNDNKDYFLGVLEKKDYDDPTENSDE